MCNKSPVFFHAVVQLITIVLFSFYASPTLAQAKISRIVIKDSDKMALIGKRILFLADSTGELSLEDVLSPENQKKFTLGEKEYTNIPATQMTYWVKLTLKNSTNQDLYLQIGDGWLAYLDFYRPNESGGYDVTKTGHFRKFNNREFKTNQFWFKVSDNDEVSDKTFYVRLNSCGYILEAPFYVGTLKPLLVQQQKYDWLIALYAGTALVMFLYNLIIYISTRDKSYLYYIIQLFIISICLLYVNGQYLHFWFYRDFENFNFYFWVANNSLPLLSALFAQSFLKINYRESILLKIIFIISFITIGIGAINLVLGITGHYELWLGEFTTLSLLLMIIFYLLILILIIDAYRKGVKEARYLLAGWSIFILCLWIYILTIDFEAFSINSWTIKSVIIGSIAEITLFSIALADRINILKKDNEKTHAIALESALENKRIIQEQNITLEKKVNERTAALNSANQNLKRKKENLEELIEEKDGLLSIVAHDLKSPLNSIMGLVKITKLEAKAPTKVLKYLQMINNLAANGRVLIEDLLTISSSNQTLMERDISEVHVFNFFTELLQPFEKNAIDKNIKFDYTITPKEDNVISTDQVSLRRIVENLVSNAIKFSPIESSIKININQSKTNLVFSIKDTGPGFSAEDQKKMFKKFQRLSAEPTHGESSTGLGLSIVKALCEKLNAKILFNSEYMKGSEFTITFKNHKINSV